MKFCYMLDKRRTGSRLTKAPSHPTKFNAASPQIMIPAKITTICMTSLKMTILISPSTSYMIVVMPIIIMVIDVSIPMRSIGLALQQTPILLHLNLGLSEKYNRPINNVHLI